MYSKNLTNNLSNDQKIILFFRNNARLIWATLLAITSLLISRYIYFIRYPFFQYAFVGEIIFAILIFFFTYYLGRTVASSIGHWFEKVIVDSFRKVISEVWAYQTSRIVEEINKDKVGSKTKKDQKEHSEEEYSSLSMGIILDTSAIIDGRILGVIKSGFLDNMILVPQNVINELQFMADKSNKLKRDKGRRGLDVLKEIRKIMGKKKFKILDIDSKSDEVDHSLVEFSKKYNTKIATVDFNLNKAAQVAGVVVININELANEIKLNVLPGELMHVKLVQEGKENGQAVGYLEDGTMIVVREGASRVGEELEVAIDKVLQTNAGRMIFASVPAN